MMEAAMKAAEAAMQEAVARDLQRQQGNGGGDNSISRIAQQAAEQHMMDLEASQASLSMDTGGDSHVEQQLNLLRALQAAEFGEQAGGLGGGIPPHVLQEMAMLGMDPNDAESMQALLHMMAQQEQENFRPEEHYLTMAQNGMILEATKTVTGFPPDALLMTSAYDAVYEDDLPGLLAIKTHFWDKGRPEVEAYIRRRTIEGDWIWLVSKAVSYVEQPIPGIILLEQVVDEEMQHSASVINRITRIAAILVQAVEAAQVVGLELSGQTKKVTSENVDDQQSDSGSVDSSNQIPWVAEDAAAYQAMLQSASAASGIDTKLDDPLFQLMKAAAAGGTSSRSQNKAAAKLEQEIMERVSGKKKESFDPFSVLEEVREGVRLDLGMIRLARSEIRMMSMILTGDMTVDDLCALVFRALNSGEGLDHALDRYMAELINCRNGPLGHSLHGAPPSISVVNLSYTYMGDDSVDLLCEVLTMDRSPVRTIDVSFCGLSDRGVLSLARGLRKRKRKGIAPLRGIIMSGNYVSVRAAPELGLALSPDKNSVSERRQSFERDESDKKSEEDFHAEQNDMFGNSKTGEGNEKYYTKEFGLQVLHLGSAMKSPDAVGLLLRGLGPKCPVRELSLTSNNIGSEGIQLIVDFLEGKEIPKGTGTNQVMPNLDRLDLSNNALHNDGLKKLTRAISKRGPRHLVELRLSNNGIAHTGIETMMNKLLQHNLVSLTLDKNAIGDPGCQLIAASLLSMKCLARLNLSFNQIGSRGVNSLMRSLVACDSITYLGLSGNIMKISGAVALAFTLAQHPRLEELDVDNCCLSQAAQCHIIAGIISNRWVPMKRMNGFEAGPPMVALGALKISAQGLSNEECFRIRKDEQMKTILQWMESNRVAKMSGRGSRMGGPSSSQNQYLTPDFVQSMNDVQGIPSQNAYLRLLGWLSRIPFDEDELISLRKYFYDSNDGTDDRGSDGYVNLKLRGDLLAALESDVADEIRDDLPMLVQYVGSVGIDIDRVGAVQRASSWEYMTGKFMDRAARLLASEADGDTDDVYNHFKDTTKALSDDELGFNRKRRIYSSAEFRDGKIVSSTRNEAMEQSRSSMSTTSKTSIRSIHNSGSHASSFSHSDFTGRKGPMKARITMFPQFEMKLEELKATATEMIEMEEDPEQQEVILTQYAEASLTILRQLRYHCMNSGLDGWRQGSMKRKVLIVDDSNVTRKLVSRAFEKANFIVDTAANGAEGVEKLKQAIYDIAFMDIDMPVMNGFEATKRLREWEDSMRPGVRQPICALTAAVVDDLERSELMKFKEAGLDVMESKPCNIPRLFKVVDDVSPMFSDLSISVIQQERRMSHHE
ncbi:PAS/PAC sensor hybrid histidine kinase [Nitzschia inconspicua]|uniref:PAS/PAC sensor hybrid histidine kinase n=1 Tax=Nitzschia inconspicua TaxID=303405 RepID=A0A9K3L851_9STRA|nr:PAS/PAC sensor hybrid histidine kinase [Nitzschia inconspicua]